MGALLFLPAAALHPTLVADPREPRSTVTVARAAVLASLADELPVVGGEAGPGAAWSLGVLAGVFMGFDPGGELTFNLLTFDGAFGLPLDLRAGPWNARLAWVHESAHLADGYRVSGGRPPEDALGTWSREALRLQVAREFGGFLPYLGAQGVTHAVDRGAGVGGQAGLVWAGPRHLFAALDVRAESDTAWRPALSAEAGLAWRGEGSRVLRLGVAAYAGPQPAGRLRDEELRYVGLRLGVDRDGPPG